MRLDIDLLSDAELDPTAFRQLYDRYAEQIHGFCLRRTGDRDAALDLTAETFAQAWQSRNRVVDEHAGSLGPWLFGIARNLVLRAVRDRRLTDEARTQLQLERERVSVSPQEAWSDGLDADLEAAIAALPLGQRRAIELRVLHDQPYKNVADGLGCSPDAARSRVSRGLATIRRQLTSDNSMEASA